MRIDWLSLPTLIARLQDEKLEHEINQITGDSER
jgi:hypothetical protein